MLVLVVCPQAFAAKKGLGAKGVNGMVWQNGTTNIGSDNKLTERERGGGV